MTPINERGRQFPGPRLQMHTLFGSQKRRGGYKRQAWRRRKSEWSDLAWDDVLEVQRLPLPIPASIIWLRNDSDTRPKSIASSHSSQEAMVRVRV